jgi:hypothetical protein
MNFFKETIFCLKKQKTYTDTALQILYCRIISKSLSTVISWPFYGYLILYSTDKSLNRYNRFFHFGFLGKNYFVFVHTVEFFSENHIANSILDPLVCVVSLRFIFSEFHDSMI